MPDAKKCGRARDRRARRRRAEQRDGACDGEQTGKNMTDVGGDEPARRDDQKFGETARDASDRPIDVAQRPPSRRAASLASGAWLSSRRAEAAEAAAEARPTPFFPGSCIDAESRARTGLSGTCLPCSVLGFERTWSATVSLAKLNCVTNPSAVKAITAVSAQAKPGATTNGVIVEVPEAELPAFDTREVGYAQLPIAPELKVEIDAPRCLALGLPISLPENAQVFIYIHPEERADARGSARDPVVPRYRAARLRRAARRSRWASSARPKGGARSAGPSSATALRVPCAPPRRRRRAARAGTSCSRPVPEALSARVEGVRYVGAGGAWHAITCR